MWNTTKIDLGNLKVGAKRQLIFSYTGDIEVEMLPNNTYFVVSSCGCATPKWNPETKEVTINYTANPVPHHLLEKGLTSYQSIKTIRVHRLEEGKHSTDILTFTADVHK